MEYKHLTPEQIEHFMKYGYIVVHNAFTPEKAAEWTQNMWVRLGLDPHDKTQWTSERIHMPWHRRELVANFAPQVWEIMKELLGGEERIDDESSAWGDSFIVNLGAPEWEGEDKVIDPRDLHNWHVDGDFFVHFLDSPEQALLVIPIFSKIEPRGGGTFISPDGLDLVANYLAEHPEGVKPTGLSFTPSMSALGKDDPAYWSHLEEIKHCNQFVEVTGDVGDVVLLHPLMMHSASRNHLRMPRVITNPPVALKQPFNFAREREEDYSVVEKKTLKALGVDRFEFKITTERQRIVPARVIAQNKMIEEEKKRLAARNVFPSVVDQPAPKVVAVA